MRYKKWYFNVLLLLLLVVIPPQGWAKTIQITKIRFSLKPEKIRLVFDITAPIKYKVSVLDDRITIIIRNAEFKTSINPKIFLTTPICAIERQQRKNDLYLTLRLKKKLAVIPEHFTLLRPHRLVFDFLNITKRQGVTTATRSDITVIQKDAIKQIENKASSQRNNTNIIKTEDKFISQDQSPMMLENDLRPIIIVIDPGHGGRDCGAIGLKGTYEKNINLAIAKELYRIINNSFGFQAVLTRNGDYFVSLRHRLEIARQHKGDIFVSIHADTYKNKKAHGVSVFALSQRGATSEAARWLAERENESELGQVIADKNHVLRSVLLDLAQTATVSASLEIGTKILHSVANFASLHTKKVEQASFVVLKAPDIPSLLVEVGFLSYKPEEEKLRNWRYQRTIAGCIALGIEAYFVRHPLPGTYLVKTKSRYDKKPISLVDTLPY